MSEKEKKSVAEKLAGKILKFLLIFVGVVAVAFVAASFVKYKTFKFDFMLITEPTFLIIAVIGILGIILLQLNNALKDKPKDSGAKVKTKGDIKKYYDTSWLSHDELKTNPKYKYCLYENLSKTDNVGIPIRAEVFGNKLHINMYDNNHTLVIGTTGAGKTTQFVDPVVQILSETHARPCLVITDPKGEIYQNHSEKLKSRGYKIMVFDLADPFKSTCWNPMTRAYMMNKRANNLEKEIMVHRGDSPKNYPHLLKTASQYYPEWYEFDGHAFADMNTCKQHLTGLNQRLKSEAVEDLKDIASVICPIENNNDPMWERGAKDLILATMLAMLEDSENEELGLTVDKFNFYNLNKILGLKDNDPYNPTKTLTDYFQGRDPLSLCVQLSNEVLTNADTTKKSFMGVVSDKINLFSDMGVCYATSKNEMDLTTFTDQPTALFIKVPDERTTRYPIASMFIAQFYKVLVDIARKNGGSLPKTVYFLLDEFANFPAIQNFETMITVARSRKIFFMLILQSYTQLDIKYKEQVAATVKDNCNIHIYIASNDQGTMEAFSKRCGNKTVETESTTLSKGKKDEQNTTTTSLAVESRPLIYPEELGSLKDEFIVSILKNPPLKSVFTPSYKPEARKFYNMTPAVQTFVMPKILNEKEVFYDIKERNKKVLYSAKSNGNPASSNLDENGFEDFNII